MKWLNDNIYLYMKLLKSPRWDHRRTVYKVIIDLEVYARLLLRCCNICLRTWKLIVVGIYTVVSSVYTHSSRSRSSRPFFRVRRQAAQQPWWWARTTKQASWRSDAGWWGRVRTAWRDDEMSRPRWEPYIPRCITTLDEGHRSRSSLQYHT